MSDLTEADVTAMRQQKDLAAFIKQAGREAAARCAARRALITRHPDLAEQVARILGHPHWNGYVAPERDATGRLNDSPIRRRLVAVLTEAEQRATTARSAA